MALLAFTKDNFKKEVLEQDLPVLVDFSAPWCGPCRILSPILEEIAREYKHKLKVGKVNIDENSEIAAHYGIMSVPTLLFFKKGRVLDQSVGVISKLELKKRVETNL